MEIERSQLSVFCGKGRSQGQGTIARFGVKSCPGGRVLTFLLVDVSISNKEASVDTDHLWVSVNKRIDKTQLRIGNAISFSCTVRVYEKGKRNNFTKSYGIGKVADLEVRRTGRGIRAEDFVKSIVNHEQVFVEHSLVG